MKRKGMPKSVNARTTVDVRFDVATGALNRWDSSIKPVAAVELNRIEIFDIIGVDYWTGGGITAASVSAKLRELAGQDVNVYINSPGGDMFEGLAIYNVLREYPGQVNVKIIGVAASAASIVALGGDQIEIGIAAFYMIHNAWILVAGNRNELREYADYLEPFDNAMAGIYAARTGKPLDEIKTMLDNETWIGGEDAVDQGFADSLLAADQVLHDNTDSASAAAKLDLVLAQSGMPRSERRKLLNQIKSGTPSAAVIDKDTPRAVDGEASKLSSQLRGILQ